MVGSELQYPSSEKHSYHNNKEVRVEERLVAESCTGASSQVDAMSRGVDKEGGVDDV